MKAAFFQPGLYFPRPKLGISAGTAVQPARKKIKHADSAYIPPPENLMPLIVDSMQGRSVWEEAQTVHLAGFSQICNRSSDCIRIALVNNMPDSALVDTECQFFKILSDASDRLPIRLKLFSLPQIPRSGTALDRVRQVYFDIEELWRGSFDAVIITGTEPHHHDLRCEPYWAALVDLLKWAEENTYSAVLSCLAAHAGVLHSDGICRHPLSSKQFGVFDFNPVQSHILMEHAGNSLRFPHSRWNEVDIRDLVSCGYTVLTHSAEAGVDMFVKKRRTCLFVHFQGHPEYDALTLLKEYRRDTRRFLKGERETCPTMPRGYFDTPTTEALNDFWRRALANRSESLMHEFPYTMISSTLRSTWQWSAACVYRNWLHYVASRKMEHLTVAATAPSGHTRAASAND